MRETNYAINLPAETFTACPSCRSSNYLRNLADGPGVLVPAVSYMSAQATLSIAAAGGPAVASGIVVGGAVLGTGCSKGVEWQCQEEIKALKKYGPSSLGIFHGSKL